MGASSFLRSRYGFYWWTNDKRPDGKRWWPAAPPKAFTSHGHSCNFCFVIPEWNLVVVRLGTEPIRSGSNALAKIEGLWDAFHGLLAGALPSPD